MNKAKCQFVVSLNKCMEDLIDFIKIFFIILVIIGIFVCSTFYWLSYIKEVPFDFRLWYGTTMILTTPLALIMSLLNKILK